LIELIDVVQPTHETDVLGEASDQSSHELAIGNGIAERRSPGVGRLERLLVPPFVSQQV
jgi:hypothetical protein